ncbi:uncharacterized protein LOC113143346 [Mastacembelus armatus]|uniref:uncharacterized protein LOC113143346 n=1 Tax=Mastacembelus armatus TaxID=205130 RepID=UPI000E4646F5|nr:uncharacterized protein LOC113143346 [Mastacembelus armatus]
MGGCAKRRMPLRWMSRVYGWIWFWSLSVSSCGDQINIRAKPGEAVTLLCRAPNSTEIRVSQWVRDDLEPEYVFMYRDHQSDPENQHPFFKERVELMDTQMKDGDVSVILKDVTFNDTGTYKCCVAHSQTKAQKLIRTIHLTVVSPGHTDEHIKDGGDKGGGNNDVGDERKYGGRAASLLLFAAVGVVIYTKLRRKQEQSSYQRPADEV